MGGTPNTRTFWIGSSNFSTNRAFVLSIEAARLLAGGGDEHAVRLLELAIKQIKEATHVRQRSKNEGPSASHSGNSEVNRP